MDATGRIWATNDNGVDVLENGQWRHFDMEDGLIWNDSDGIALYVDGENRVWIGTSNGLSRYAPLSYVVPDEPPTVVLTAIRGESREWQNNEQAILPYAHRSLTIRFASLKYAYESRTRFLYRLRGYDKSWKQATEQSVNFTALPAGNYVFEVIAVTPSGQSSLMPASFRFTIKSPWWQSWWFLTSCLLLVGPLLHLLWRVRVSMLLAQRTQLENIVAERTAELSESHRLLEQIAYVDSLTSLPNRRMFTESFRNRLALAQKKGECVVLLLVDLDRFKEINDHLGHDAGDAVLIEAASRLRKAVRESDCVARVGGDEFGIILLTPHRLEDVQALCERILESFVEGILFKDKVLKTTPSIGVAIFPEHGDSQESLYKSADLALYEAKRMGRNGFCWYNPALFTEN
jgi:diguanylate cyclase (GGDEF)-like protein